MTLLDDVISGASGSAPLAMLLRQMKVLAARTNAAPLAQWVEDELNGYDVEKAEIPPYRGPIRVPVYGHYMGFGGDQMKNVHIQPYDLPEQYRDGGLFHRWFWEPIANIEAWAERPEPAIFGWPDGGMQLYGMLVASGEASTGLRGDFVLAQAKIVVDRSVTARICEVVRNRVLELALAIEKVAPAAGEASASTEQRADAVIAINNFFYGQANVAVGGGAVTQNVTAPAPAADDTAALMRYLLSAGLPKADGDKLAEAIAADEEAGPDDRRWPRVRAWFAETGTAVGANALGSALATAATSFLGG